jgi:hypothetical protein
MKRLFWTWPSFSEAELMYNKLGVKGAFWASLVARILVPSLKTQCMKLLVNLWSSYRIVELIRFDIIRSNLPNRILKFSILIKLLQIEFTKNSTKLIKVRFNSIKSKTNLSFLTLKASFYKGLIKLYKILIKY